ncbi:MAG: T9SS type A sorting domain-containing protein [Sporocytophaga sp.]|uniref:T9SS type A sorting domain-containing protein n=1 Tax=Sporocytophaga sp. TaxID=2231183 RepID=UPI001B263A27|nr:T9SS type A sorting domain-containing protein [Sporocytophaga sp.]MBO9701797.1 T9SS type A sorting domain-containing protein [Sporocytophaga sp.]
MKKPLLNHHYNRILALFYKLKLRLNKNFSTGRFKELSKQKQFKLLRRLEKLKLQLSRIENKLKYGSLAFATTVGIGLTATESSSQTLPAGDEFRVNTYTTNVQMYAKTAMDSDGDFVVTWASRGQDTPTEYGIYAQRYNAQGVAQGAEFRVNTYTPDRQSNPAIAMDDNGNFVIVWTSSGQDGNMGGVFGQRFNAAGQAIGSEFQVNTTTSGNQYSSAVAMDSDGDFAVTWSSPNDADPSYGVYARCFDATGAAKTGEIHVNTYTTGIQRFSTIAMDNDGDFLVAWQSEQDGSSYGIYGQRFNVNGVPQGSEFRVNTITENSQKSVAAAMDQDGDFVIAWQSIGQEGTGNSDGIYAQRFNASGVGQGTEFHVNTYQTGAQSTPAVAMNNNEFIITWTSNGQDGSETGVYAQRFNASGLAQGDEFRVNSYIAGSQGSSAIAIDNDNDFIIAWTSANQDGSANGVYAQRYEANKAPSGIALSGNIVNENAAANTTIGTFTTEDVNINNTFTYTLVAGAGNTDNASFIIADDKLQIKVTPDFETKNNYSIRVRSTDQGGLFFEKVFTINIINVNEAPTDLSFSSTSVVENIPLDTEVGTFTTTDEDAADTFIYTLVEGTGSDNNASFAIEGNKLLVKESPDFETMDDFSIRVRSTDQKGLSFEKVLTIDIININEAPIDFYISSTTLDENEPDNAVVGTFATTDLDETDSFTYKLVAGVGDDDNSSFTIVGDKLHIVESPDFETKDIYTIRVKSTDQGGLSLERIFDITIENVAETGIAEKNEFSATIQLYPNPAKETVMTNLEGSVMVRILDLSGHVVRQSQMNNQIISMEGLATGIYMLEFTQDGKTGMKKLVIE